MRTDEDQAGGQVGIKRLVKLFPQKYRRFATYVLVGIMNTAVDFLVFTIVLTFFTGNRLIAQTSGYLAGLLNSFVFNRNITFGKDSDVPLGRQIAKFLLVNGVAYGVSLAAIEIFTAHMGMNVYLAKVLTSGAVMVTNYLLYKTFVFMVKDKEKK